MTNRREEQIKYANEELIDQGKLAIMDSVFTTDYIAHAEDKEHKGHEFVKRFAKQLRTAILDINCLR